MTLHGKIVVIKRNGADGAHFPLTAEQCLFGRTNECDIRIQLPNVSREHCRIDVQKDGEVHLVNLSQVNPTLLNGKAVMDKEAVLHKDVFTIVDRSFRFEYPPGSERRNAVNPEVQSPEISSTTAKAPSAGGDTPRSTKKGPGSANKLTTPAQKKAATPAKGTPKAAAAATPKSPAAPKTPKSAKKESPKAAAPTPKSAKKESPKAATPAPKSLAPPKSAKKEAPKATTPAPKSPAAPKTPKSVKKESPKATTPVAKSPATPKTAKSAKKESPKAATTPKSKTPAKKTPVKASPKTPTPKKASPAPVKRASPKDAKTPPPAAKRRSGSLSKSGGKMTAFGSPRVPQTTPLKNSISQLRRRSAPVKEEEESVSPAKKATPKKATPKKTPSKAPTPKSAGGVKKRRRIAKSDPHNVSMASPQHGPEKITKYIVSSPQAANSGASTTTVVHDRDTDELSCSRIKMGSKVEGKKFQDLICPMCLNVFENATLLGCGHTFCKGCLEAYDEQHNDLDHIVCPVCRKNTHLGQDRVAGLAQNFSVKGIQDEVRLEVKDSPPNVCPLHKADYKTLFCEVCTEFICITCFIDKHQGHKIMKKEEFESELKKTRDALIQKGLIRKTKIEKSVLDAEQERGDMFCHLSTVENEIRNTCTRKRTLLQENEERLLKQVDDTRKDLDKQLECSIANNRKFIDNIDRSIEGLMGRMIEQFDSVKLKAHQVKCGDLENSLKKTNDKESNLKESLAGVKQRVEGVQFCPADETLLTLGHLEFGGKATSIVSNVQQASLQRNYIRSRSIANIN